MTVLVMRGCFKAEDVEVAVGLWSGGGGLSDLSAGTHIVVVVLLLLRLVVAFWSAVVAGGLDTHDIAVPGGRADGGQLQQLLV